MYNRVGTYCCISIARNYSYAHAWYVCRNWWEMQGGWWLMSWGVSKNLALSSHKKVLRSLEESFAVLIIWKHPYKILTVNSLRLTEVRSRCLSFLTLLFINIVNIHGSRGSYVNEAQIDLHNQPSIHSAWTSVLWYEMMGWIFAHTT